MEAHRPPTLSSSLSSSFPSPSATTTTHTESPEEGFYSEPYIKTKSYSSSSKPFDSPLSFPPNSYSSTSTITNSSEIPSSVPTKSKSQSTATQQKRQQQKDQQQHTGESEEKKATDGKRKRPSRRVTQRLLARKRRSLQSTLEKHESNVDKHLKCGIIASLERSSTLHAKATFLTKQKCKRTFGFASDPSLPV